MKYAILALSILISTRSFCQKADSATYLIQIGGDTIYKSVEQMPEYPGGDEALMRFIQHNIKYPKVEAENDIQGKVVVGFVIGEDGSINDISIKKGVNKGIDEEAIRVVKLLPKFKPGKQKGEPVKVAFILPINFVLSTGEPERKNNRHKKTTPQ